MICPECNSEMIKINYISSKDVTLNNQDYEKYVCRICGYEDKFISKKESKDDSSN